MRTIVLKCCFVLFIWIGVLFLIYCICLLVYTCVIDDTQFEQQPEQDFGDEQQQQFEEGKWPLDHTLVPNNSQFIYFYFIACMSL